MDTRSTRRRNKTARSLALVVLATSMLPLNGCLGPLAQALGPLTQVLGAVSGVMNLGETLSSFTGGSSNSGSSSNFTSSLSTQSFDNLSGSHQSQTSDAAQGVLGTETGSSQDEGARTGTETEAGY